MSFINPATNQEIGEIVQTFDDRTISLDSFGNGTSFNLEKDYFTPANAFSFVIEDNRIERFQYFMQRGYKVKLIINNCPNGTYYIFDYKLSYNRHGGTRLQINCKDLLEYMAQGSIYPNMPTSLSDFKKINLHFSPETSLGSALQLIATSFSFSTEKDISVISEDNRSLTNASGYQVGFRKKTPDSPETALSRALNTLGHRSFGKTAKGQATSLQKFLNHQTTPSKGESYLGYMLRLSKMAGFEIKMDQSDESVIIVKPPTYDRTLPSPYTLRHAYGEDAEFNNVLEGSLNFNLDRQPSVVIVETNTAGNGLSYAQSTVKGIAVNELTAYPLATPSNPKPDPIQMVQNAVNILTTGVYGSGYIPTPFNEKLYHNRTRFPIDIITEVSMPFYTISSNAHDGDEAAFAAAMILAEAQDKYIEMHYKVQGWSQNGVLWQPDMLVGVLDASLGHQVNSTALPILMYIRKVNYIKSRNGGTETILTCTLPYTHNFSIPGEVS